MLGRAWLDNLISIREEGEVPANQSAFDNNFAILDQITAHFGAVHFCYMAKVVTDGDDANAPKLRALALVTGAIAHFLEAIASLCRRGLDVATKSLVRVWLEYMDLLSLLMREDVVDEFNIAETPEDANRFWHKYISRSKLQKSGHEFMARKLGYTPAQIDELRDWENEELAVLGASIHPSRIAAFMACAAIPVFDGNALGGFIGGLHDSQFRTTRLIFLKTLTFVALHEDFPFGPSIGLSKSNEDIMHQYAADGGIVLKVILADYIKNYNSPKYHQKGPFSMADEEDEA